MSRIKFRTMNLEGYGYGSNTVAMSSPTSQKLLFDIKTFIVRNKNLLLLASGAILTGAFVKRKKIIKRVKKLW